MTSSFEPTAEGDLGVVVARLQAQYIRGAPPRQVFDALLPELLSLTDSEYGLIGEVWHDGDGQPFLKVFTLTDIAWDEPTRALVDRQRDGGLEFRNLQSLLCTALRTGQPVLSDRPATDARRSGLPRGHPPLNAFAGVPLFHGGAMVGEVGLANRPGGYDHALLGRLGPLFSTVGAILGQVQAERARQQAEQALRASEAMYRATFEVAPVGIAQLGLDGLHLDVNPQLCQILGRDAAALRGLRVHDIVHPDDAAADLPRHQLLLDGALDHYDGETRFLRPDGSIVWTWRTVALLREHDGRPRRLVSTLEDIGERLQLEQARVAAAAAERANRAKTEFLSRMSHELRTPLNAVLGFAQLLRLDEREPLPPRQREHVQHIERAGLHLLDMINDVLDLSRIEEGSLALQCEPVLLLPLVEAVLALLGPAAATAGVTLACEPGATGDRVLADAVRLRQVLVNLLSNAVKYNHMGGRATVGWQTVAGGLRLWVRDTGPGLSETQQAHLFEPFNRLGAERRRIEGTGIGLVITRRLVHLMRGTLEVHSEIGVGSCFSVSLPLPAG